MPARRSTAHTPGTAWSVQGAMPAVLCLALLGSGLAQAAEPIGPTGPLGPTGPIGPAGAAAPVAPSRTEPPTPPRTTQWGPAPRPAPPTPPRAGDAPSGNRIEVTGNTATGVRCSGEGAASVNSVDVSGARMEGRTVIVQGRNASDVHSTRDCPERLGAPAQGTVAPGQTNSIRIR